MRKFQPDEDYSTKNSNRFDERCLYIVKCDEDFFYTEAYLSPEFIREYSIGSSFKVEPLRSPGGTQAFLLEQWGYYYLLLAYEREAVFMMMVDIWGNETVDQWAFHLVGEQDYIIGTKEGKFVDMLFLRDWLQFLVKKYTSELATCGGNPLSGSPPAVEI